MKNTAQILLLLSLLFVSGNGQISQKEIYGLLLSQAGLVSNYSDSNSSSKALLDSAAFYAQDSLWEIANIFLEQYIAQSRTASQTELPQYNKFENTKSIDINIITGIDFNNQEFELGYLQTDSVITDQISKPFIGIGLHKDIFESSSSTISLNTDFRLDRENFSANASFNGNFFSENSNFVFEAGAVYDKNKAYPEFTFFETNSRQNFFWNMAKRWELRGENYLRFKKYDTQSSVVNDFFNDIFRLNLNYLQNYYLHYELDYNESIDYESNDYFEQTLYFQNMIYFLGSSRVNSQAGVRSNNFSYSLGDSVIHNNSFSILADIEIYLPLTEKLIWKTEYNFKSKKFEKVSEQDVDYNQHRINTVLRNKFFNSFFFDAGYLYENKIHHSIGGGLAVYINEQNYYENGLLAGIDYQNFEDLFISLSASYSFRRYPEAASDQVLSLYSSRNILNLSLFMQMPILDKLMFNLFAAYDNDQDLDNDEDKIRSTMFSAELQYQF